MPPVSVAGIVDVLTEPIALPPGPLITVAGPQTFRSEVLELGREGIRRAALQIDRAEGAARAAGEDRRERDRRLTERVRILRAHASCIGGRDRRRVDRADRTSARTADHGRRAPDRPI